VRPVVESTMPFDRSNAADRILTEDEVAALTSFSTRTLQSWRQRNVGPPFIRVRRSIRYSEADVLAWMKAKTHDPEASNSDS
jgi:predicted DNA-binding transcriptional regulator AlpA